MTNNSLVYLLNKYEIILYLHGLASKDHASKGYHSEFIFHKYIALTSFD